MTLEELEKIKKDAEETKYLYLDLYSTIANEMMEKSNTIIKLIDELIKVRNEHELKQTTNN